MKKNKGAIIVIAIAVLFVIILGIITNKRKKDALVEGQTGEAEPVIEYQEVEMGSGKIAKGDVSPLKLLGLDLMKVGNSYQALVTLENDGESMQDYFKVEVDVLDGEEVIETISKAALPIQNNGKIMIDGTKEYKDTYTLIARIADEEPTIQEINEILPEGSKFEEETEQQPEETQEPESTEETQEPESTEETTTNEQ